MESAGRDCSKLQAIKKFKDQVLHGSRKTFRSRITKSNFSNSLFTGKKNQLITHHENNPVLPSVRRNPRGWGEFPYKKDEGRGCSSDTLKRTPERSDQDPVLWACLVMFLTP